MQVRVGGFGRGGILWVGLLTGCAVVGGWPRAATSQTGAGGSGVGAPGMPYPPRGEQGDAAKQDPGMARLQEQQTKSRNDDRQRRMVDDTAKLYALAGELKEEVAKSDKNKMSLEVIKKAEEIEHLAHSVKDRMKG